MNNEDTRPVGILIFDDVEVLDFSGPFEVFNHAGKLTLALGETTVPKLSPDPDFCS